MVDFNKRERGFYWVKWLGEWMIAAWGAPFGWIGVLGLRENYYTDESFDEINENRIMPPS